MLQRSATALAVFAFLAGPFVGCGRGQSTIPPGGQQVHVVVTDTEVRLTPATVRAGDIYVVLDTPGSGVSFAQRKRTEEETPGPMTDEDLVRLARGDTQGTAIEAFSDSGCSQEQRAEDRGRMGPCGNVAMVVLTEGKYAFFIGEVDTGAPKSIAVLQVVP